MRISDWSSDVCSSDLTRISQMMAFGRDGILDSDAVLAVADYAKTLSDPAWAKGRAASVASGREVFAANCVVCHGEQGRGSTQLGAPNLPAQSWVSGGDIGAIRSEEHTSELQTLMRIP